MKSHESELIRQVRTGDTGAFYTLHEMYREIAYHQALHLVGNAFEAEDIVQIAMYRAYSRIDQLADPNRFSAWLSAIVRNASMDHLRSRYRLNEHTEDIHELDTQLVLQRTSVPSEGLAAFSTGDDKMMDAVAHLSPALAEVIELRIRSRLKISEISDHLHIPIGTVKRRLHDAKIRLRGLTMRTFDEDTARRVVNDAKLDIEALPAKVKQEIIGIAIGGDLARKEFVPNNSVLLIVPLFSNRTSLLMYETEAYRAIEEIFDKHCKPFFDCTESPTVWENLAFDELHLPTSAEMFDPPTSPQPQWHSMYLFDLIDHHEVTYGINFIQDLYRPDPRSMSARIASEILRVARSTERGTLMHPMGAGTLLHWQVLKMVKLLQIHFTEGTPTISMRAIPDNYNNFVPDFPTKEFGSQVYRKSVAARYPADRKEYTERYSKSCQEFIAQGCKLFLDRR